MRQCVLLVELEKTKTVFNGHTWVQSIKFQSAVCPNGTIANLFGPIEEPRHDSFMLARSEILHQLDHHSFGRHRDKPCIYGDPQWFSQYFETLWCFNKFSFHQKWNDARLIFVNIVYPSCLTSCWTT